jgi:hypothetical protein
VVDVELVSGEIVEDACPFPDQLIELLSDRQFSVETGPEIIDAVTGSDKLSNLIRDVDCDGSARNRHPPAQFCNADAESFTLGKIERYDEDWNESKAHHVEPEVTRRLVQLLFDTLTRASKRFLVNGDLRSARRCRFRRIRKASATAGPTKVIAKISATAAA